MERKQTLFTIGQFAAIHGITKKTLMWYDEMGLVRPALIGENGYRYYSYRQSSELETVLMLRELEVSIPEIKLFMEQRSAANMERLLAEKQRKLEEKIAHLRRMQRPLESRHQDMLTLLNLERLRDPPHPSEKGLPGSGSAERGLTHRPGAGTGDYAGQTAQAAAPARCSLWGAKSQ